LPGNDFLPSQDSHPLRDLTADRRRGASSSRRPRVGALSKTRMNTRLLRRRGGREYAGTAMLTRGGVL
jgi:hypothetical protein